MARTRQSRAGLTESWDAVDEREDFDDQIYDDTEEKEELGSSYFSNRSSRSRAKPDQDDDENGEFVSPEASRNARQNGRIPHDAGFEREEIKPRKRNTRSSVDQGLVMPSSPDALNTKAAKLRASTPHFRANQRSLTSDAGQLRRAAARDAPKTKDEFDDEIDETSDLNWPIMLWDRALKPVVGYAIDIVRILVTSKITKNFIAVWLAIGIFMFVRNFVTQSVNNALSPLCRIPGSSYLNLPFCPIQIAPELSGPAEFDKLVDAQSQFEEVLAASAGGAFLPVEMKNSEAGIRDLKHVVQYSSLPSRNELVFEFSGFIDTARQASQDLSKFNSRIGRAVDQILSTNRWTLQVIDGVAEQQASRGGIENWVSRNLNIFAPFQPVALSRDVLLDQYLRHTGAVEEQILSLISEAQALLSILDNLDSRLDVIAGIATRDGIKVENNRDELFSFLWTKVGGHRGSVAKIEKQLNLLNDVGQYRRMAWAHVNGAIIKLMAIRDNLEDLRERVAMPEIVGEKVPLEVHIENINLGIERLEAQRDNGRKLEAENYARVLSRAEEKGRMIEGKREL